MESVWCLPWKGSRDRLIMAALNVTGTELTALQHLFIPSSRPYLTWQELRLSFCSPTSVLAPASLQIHPRCSRQPRGSSAP